MNEFSREKTQKTELQPYARILWVYPKCIQTTISGFTKSLTKICWALRNSNATLERRESGELATKQPATILGYEVHKVSGRVVQRWRYRFHFYTHHLRRRLEWITNASRRFNSGWATRNSKETGLGLTVLTYHGKDKYRTSQIIQFQNVEAKYIFLPLYAIHFGHGLKEEEISQFG